MIEAKKILTAKVAKNSRKGREEVLSNRVTAEKSFYLTPMCDNFRRESSTRKICATARDFF